MLAEIKQAACGTLMPKALNDAQLDYLLAHYKNHTWGSQGVPKVWREKARDIQPSEWLNYSSGILNWDGNNAMGGTHWYAYKYTGGCLYIFDPVGYAPDIEIMYLHERAYGRDSMPIYVFDGGQTRALGDGDDLCGLWCVWWLITDQAIPGNLDRTHIVQFNEFILSHFY